MRITGPWGQSMTGCLTDRLAVFIREQHCLVIRVVDNPYQSGFAVICGSRFQLFLLTSFLGPSRGYPLDQGCEFTIAVPLCLCIGIDSAAC